MEDIRACLQQLARWAESEEVPPIPFLGMAGSRFRNPPAPHLELALVTRGKFDWLRVGDRQVSLPTNALAAHTVHFGNESSVNEDAMTWCVFFDVSGIPGLEILQQRPVVATALVEQPGRLTNAFQSASLRCRTAGAPMPDYILGPPAYEPSLKPDLPVPVFLKLKAALLELLAVVLEELGCGGRRELPARPESVRLALEFMARQYRDPTIMLADVADSAHLSPSHFSRVFSAQMGVPPMRYLRRVRIENARFLLERTSLRIGEVAREVGFSDSLYFSRVFREAEGVCPSGWRKARKGIRE
jgi:AraC-like DNA-binding protein